MPTTYGETAAMELGRRVANEMDTARDRTPDSLADLFAPDIVLPEQFFEGARRDSCISGEKALMLAVLEDGIRCFQEHLRNARSNPRLLSQQAEEWIRAVDYEWPFSFNNVCDALGIDPDCMRDALLRMKYERLMAEARPRSSAPARTARIVRLNARAKGGKR